MIRLDAATVLLQWATGGMLFCWVTTRRRQVGLGYGWLLRGTYVLLALGAVALGGRYGLGGIARGSAVGVVVATSFALVVSIVRRDAGVSGQRAEHDRRTARVAAMTGIDRRARRHTEGEHGADDDVANAPEFPPVLDIVPVLVGAIGLVAAGISAAPDTSAGTMALSVARVLSGAAFLGSVSDAMLLGHWYLVQPGLPRRLLSELVNWVGWSWPVEVGLMLIPPGMIEVWLGQIDDGWGGMLGWFWGACAIATIVLVVVTKAALRERGYSAVMAATGLLYLAILTAFGTDLVARAVLAGAGSS